LTAGRGLCQVDSMREPEMTIPPIEYLTAANVRRLSDPKVMGFGAYRHPYPDDAYAAMDVAAPLAQMPSHRKASPLCRAFSLLFEIDHLPAQAQRRRTGGLHRARDEPEMTFGVDPLAYGPTIVRIDEPSAKRVDVTVAEDLRGIRRWCERGPGIAHVRGIEPRPVATVGYDDPTGDDVAADWRRS